MSVLRKSVEKYRALPGAISSVLAFLASLALTMVSGLLGAITAMYLYDRANSKGDDLAVGLGGFFAVGTFVFVILFTYSQKAHHGISYRTPVFALCACFFLAAVITLVSWDEDYSTFMLGDWLVILLFGLVSLWVCRRWHA